MSTPALFEVIGYATGEWTPYILDDEVTKGCGERPTRVTREPEMLYFWMQRVVRSRLIR